MSEEDVAKFVSIGYFIAMVEMRHVLKQDMFAQWVMGIFPGTVTFESFAELNMPHMAVEELVHSVLTSSDDKLEMSLLQYHDALQRIGEEIDEDSVL